MRPRPRHPFFQNGKLEMAWDWCNNPDNADVRLESLLDLACNRERMPGAVFFEVPEGAESDNKWSAVINASEPHCQCPSRRIMFPTQGRTRLLASNSATRLVRIEFDYKYHAANVYSSPPLAFVPHGGDVAAAYAAFAIRKDGLMVESRPFMADKRPDVRHIWTQMDGVADLAPSMWYASREVLQDLLRLHGEVPFMQAMPDPERRRGYWGRLPVCSLIEVSGTGETSFKLTLEVDHTVHVIPNLSEKDPEHVCPASAK